MDSMDWFFSCTMRRFVIALGLHELHGKARDVVKSAEMIWAMGSQAERAILGHK